MSVCVCICICIGICICIYSDTTDSYCHSRSKTQADVETCMCTSLIMMSIRCYCNHLGAVALWCDAANTHAAGAANSMYARHCLCCWALSVLLSIVCDAEFYLCFWTLSILLMVTILLPFDYHMLILRWLWLLPLPLLSSPLLLLLLPSVFLINIAARGFCFLPEAVVMLFC